MGAWANTGGRLAPGVLEQIAIRILRFSITQQPPYPYAHILEMMTDAFMMSLVNGE